MTKSDVDINSFYIIDPLTKVVFNYGDDNDRSEDISQDKNNCMCVSTLPITQKQKVLTHSHGNYIYSISLGTAVKVN